MSDPFDRIPADRREDARSALTAAFGPAPLTALQPLTSGASALSYRIEVADRPYLLRLESLQRDEIRDPERAYRCMRTAQEAVHTDIETSRSVYNFVNDLCVKLGANPDDLVPFEKYAAAAQSLTRPASAARALQNGAPNIERADKLVQLIAKQKGLSHPTIDATVALVDSRLEANRKKAAAA